MARNPMTPFRSGGLLGSDPFMSLHRDVNRLFEDAFRGMPSSGGAQGAAGNLINAHMNVSETDKEIRITAAALADIDRTALGVVCGDHPHS